MHSLNFKCHMHKTKGKFFFREQGILALNLNTLLMQFKLCLRGIIFINRFFWLFEKKSANSK